LKGDGDLVCRQQNGRDIWREELSRLHEDPNVGLLAVFDKKRLGR
jgi:hypothetical protein